MSERAQSHSAKLKDEGNALFKQKQYRAVSKKYTEAIQVDGANAVLYCNRSACAFAMSRSENQLWTSVDLDLFLMKG